MESAVSKLQKPDEGVWIQAHGANNLFDALWASALANPAQQIELISLCRYWRAHPETLLSQLVLEEAPVASRRLESLISDLEKLSVGSTSDRAMPASGDQSLGPEAWSRDPLDRLGPSGDAEKVFCH